MAFSGASLFFWRSPNPDTFMVAKVNGQTITLKKYKHAFAAVQERIRSIKDYARMLGITDDNFLRYILGSKDGYQMALDGCIKEALFDQVSQPFSIMLAEEYFKEQLFKKIPQGLLNETGQINLDAYQHYVSTLSMTPREYEAQEEEQIKRDLISHCISSSYYAPWYSIKDRAIQETSKKSFEIVSFSFDTSLEKAKTTPPTAEQLAALYDENKESFRIPEKRRAWYWQIPVDQYAKTLEVNDEAVQEFYNKNKSSLFRIPPKVKVRKIMIKETTEQAFQKAQEVHTRVQEKPQEFVAAVKEYSQDEKTQKNGGIVDFFKRGTYDPSFEQAAFALHTKGEVSPIIKTADGYEILQLEERVNAVDKPFDEVQGECVTLIRNKRALNELKAEFEMMLRQESSNENIFDDFIRKHKLEKQQSRFLSLSDNNEKASDLEKSLTQKLFSAKNNRETKIGYFFTSDAYVLYQLHDVENSYVKTLDEVKNDVTDRWYRKQAKVLQQDMVASIKDLIFNKKMSLIDAARANELAVMSTPFLKKGEEIKELKGVKSSGSISSAAFILNDPMQLYTIKQNKNHYIIRLKEATLANEDEVLQKKDKLLSAETMRGQGMYLGAFIASLQRNAKIETNDKILEMYKGR